MVRRGFGGINLKNYRKLKRITEISKKIKSIKLDIEACTDQKDVLQVGFNLVQKEMYDEIESIKAKHKKDIDSFSGKIDSLNEKITKGNSEIIKLKIEQNWIEALNRGEINEFYLKSMLEKCGVNFYHIMEMKHKQKLKNNVDVWMIVVEKYPNDYKLYLAFYGTELVGTSYRKIPKHTGDETWPFSFIGNFNDLIMMPAGYKSGDHEMMKNATFQQWLRDLKVIEEGDLALIPINDDTLSEITNGINEYWGIYSWDDKPSKLTMK